jgi:glyoxylase-like metal-dependent hydrolase (beta-lactamase superfamily II)
VLCPPGRRDFLRFLTGGAAGISLFHSTFPSQARAQTGLAPLAATRLTDTFLHITGAGSNVLAVIGTDSVLLVDGGLAERSRELLQLVAEQSGGKPIHVLFNTHWHPEHTGSNETLGQAGAKIIAHENTKLWLGAEFEVAWQKRTYEPRPKVALPNQTFYTSGKMMFGTEPIEFGYMLQAHTDGDIYVYFPGPNILVTGDVVSASSYPILDYSTGGWLGGLIEGQKTLLKVANADTRIIPGDGAVMTRAGVQSENDMCSAVRERLVKLLRMGYGPKEMVAAAPTKDFDEKWGHPELFILNAYRGLWGHVRELGGIV